MQANDPPEVLLGQVRTRAAAEARLLQHLLSMPPSLVADQAVREARERYEQLQHQSVELALRIIERCEERIAELERANAELRDANEGLQRNLARTQYELQRALGVKSKSGQASPKPNPCPPQTDSEGRHAGKRGAPKGHRGNTRPIPDSVDVETVIGPPQFCDCGADEVVPLTEFDLRYVEDIPPVTRIVTRYIYLWGRCGQCGKVVRHPEGYTGPPVRTGPNLAAHLTVISQMGMTFRKLSALSSDTLGIALTPSGALGIVERVGDSLLGPYRDILEAVRQQLCLNGDETGWKILGKNCYIWCFCNKHLAYFHPDASRAAEVIESILGKDFPGIVICDFYAAYNCLSRTQRCLVHLLRDIAKEREVLPNSKKLERFENAVRDFIRSGLQAQAMPEGEEKAAAVDRLRRQLRRLANAKVTEGKATTLVKRIEKYQNDIIRFVTHPDVEFHNNRAERQLRPLVIARKVSFGSATEHGALRYCVIHSVIETCRLRGIEPIEFIRRAYQSGGLDVPDLVANSPPAA